MSSRMIEAWTPQARLAMALALTLVFLAAGLAVPSVGMSTAYVDATVPQIVTVSGP